MVTRLAAEFPGRQFSVTADSAYAGDELKKLPPATAGYHPAETRARRLDAP